MHAEFDAFERNAANHVALSPVSFLERAALVHRDATATVHGSTRRSWSELRDRVRRVAGGLAAHGIGLGDTVTVLAPDLPALFELHFAVPMTGGVLCTINTRLEPATIAYIVAHSDSRLILVGSDLRPLLTRALSEVQDPPTVIEIPTAEAQATPGAATYDDLLASAPLTSPGLPADEWQAIALNYTSGTSGRPKGVVYHHRGAYLMALGTVAPGRSRAARPISASCRCSTATAWAIPG